MDPSNAENELRNALTAFETSVTTPIVSGELANWMQDVQATWSAASTQVHNHINDLHPRQYQEISQEDPSLFQQIELLKAEDEAIERERDKLNRQIAQVAQQIPNLEPDEAKARRHVKHLIDGGVVLVARVRKQEVAVQTWFVEAFDRERGGGD